MEKGAPVSTIPAYATDADALAVFDLRAYLARAGEHALQPHRHRFWQLIVFRESVGVHEVDMVERPFGANSVVLLAEGAVHRFADADADGWLVHFAADHFVRTERDAGTLMHLRVLAGQTPLLELDDATFRRTMDSLAEEYGREPRDLDLERSLLDVLLRAVMRALPDAHRDDAVLRFLARVEARYTHHDPVGAYAKALGMGERGLFEVTRRALDKTPGEVLVDRVMLEARRQLAHSEQQVSQIAYALGYADPGYFARLFKKHFGLSPTAYRDGR